MSDASNIISVERNGRIFSVDLNPTDQISDLLLEEYRRFWTKQFTGTWESDTLRILDEFLSPTSLYIDIGSWIGPTALYASSQADRVICLEPDPVAHAALVRNIAVNPRLHNVEVFNVALGPEDGHISIGGNGLLGNSESTILVEEPTYLYRKAAQSRKATDRKNQEWRAGATTTARMVSPSSLFSNYNSASNTLVKMDIEGGEKLTLPPLIDVLRRYNSDLLLSLHWVYLTKTEITDLLNHLFSSNFTILEAATGNEISQDSILKYHTEQIICLPRSC